MNGVERWVLRVADSELTWMGLNWLRPEKRTHISVSYILFSSILLGLPGLLLGAGAIYVFIGRADMDVWLFLFILVMMVELPLHIVFAHFWNQRAKRLEREGTAS